MFEQVKEIKKIIEECDSGQLEEAKTLLAKQLTSSDCELNAESCNLTSLAIIYSSLPTLKMLKEEDLLFPCSELLGHACWQANNVQMLEFLLAEGFVPDEDCYKCAAESGTLDNIFWLQSKNCPLPKTLDLTVVREMGYQEVLDYLAKIEGLEVI